MQVINKYLIMQLSITTYFLLMMTATLTTCSCSSIPIKTDEHLLLSSQQSDQKSQEPRISDHRQQNFQTQQQQKVKYSTLQDDVLVEAKMRSDEDLHQNDTFVSRTFGLRHRLKLAIPAIMFKLGVATTMLAVLTLLSAKSLLVGLLILIIQISTSFAKLVALKKDHHQHESWNQEPPHGKPPQDIHVHVHGNHGSHVSHGNHGGHHKPTYSYSPWSKSDLLNTNNRIDEDYFQRLKELQELKELRESLYTQVI